MTRKESEELALRMNEWTKQLDALPADEARREAHDLLFSAGIVDDKHNFKEPYKAIFA